MAKGSRRRALVRSPASSGSKPRAVSKTETVALAAASLPAMNMTGRCGRAALSAIRLAPTWLSVLTMRACGIHCASVSAAEVVKPRSNPSLPSCMESGFMQSITILSFSPPSALTAPSATSQGSARTTSSAAAAASAGGFASARVSCASAVTLGADTSRTPRTTRCPERDQPRASALPTFPVPMMAIVTAASLG